MRTIDFLNEVVCMGKSPYMRILKKFIDQEDFMAYKDLIKENYFYFYTSKVIPNLVNFGILIEEEYKWKTGMNLHKEEGKAIVGKRWKINNENEIVKKLKEEMKE